MPPPNDPFNDPTMRHEAPALDAARHPPLRGATTDKAAAVVGVNYRHQSQGRLGSVDTPFGQAAGVYGESPQQGVFGHATDAQGTGVFGNATGTGFGVRGDSQDGVAVQGQSFGDGIAVQGLGGKLAGRFVGQVLVEGDLEVTGDIRLTQADVAEDFSVLCADDVIPGMVMVIDAGGALKPCASAYDRRVAGVISGAGLYKPALILDTQPQQPSRRPLALVGKVYCLVDTSQQAIEVGDLLTTSSIPGHAMCASDPSKTHGAVIGKALAPLAAGQQGLIPILVALQ